MWPLKNYNCGHTRCVNNKSTKTSFNLPLNVMWRACIQSRLSWLPTSWTCASGNSSQLSQPDLLGTWPLRRALSLAHSPHPRVWTAPELWSKMFRLKYNTVEHSWKSSCLTRRCGVEWRREPQTSNRHVDSVLRAVKKNKFDQFSQKWAILYRLSDLQRRQLVDKPRPGHRGAYGPKCCHWSRCCLQGPRLTNERNQLLLHLLILTCPRKSRHCGLVKFTLQLII